MPPSLDLLYNIDVAYARYNALKTFADARESQFVATQMGSVWVTHDVAREDGYYNRVVGFGREAAGQLAELLAVFPEEVDGIRVDVAEGETAVVQAELEAQQFVKTGVIHWLWRPLEQGGNQHVHWCGTEAEDIERLRPLLEFGRPKIADELWAARSHYLVSEQFRTFAIWYGDDFLAMASSFFGDRCVFLGNAFTLPKHRKLGFHGRLLAARLNHAYEAFEPAPNTVAFVDVEPRTMSEQNCLKKGFMPLVMMETWERGQTSR